VKGNRLSSAPTRPQVGRRSRWREGQRACAHMEGVPAQVAQKRERDDRPQSPRKRRRSRFATAPVPSSSSTPLDKEQRTTTPVTASADDEIAAADVSPPSAAIVSSSPTLARRDSGRDTVADTQVAVDLAAIPVAPVSTLKINQQVARKEKILQSLKDLEADLLDTDPSRNAFFDPDIRMDSRTRRAPRRDFNFISQGSIAAQAEKQRFREAMATRAAQVGSMPDLPPLDSRLVDESRRGSVPTVEWWDAPFCIGVCYPDTVVELVESGCSEEAVERRCGTSLDALIRADRVTHYVHHPVRIPSYKSEKPAPVLPLMLTEKERKRLRRQRRAEAEKERREMVAVGLLPPPPPKVKLSNLMRVLANEASADPTRVEADVRAQVEERQRKHEEDNEARRNTKEEFRDKKLEKTQRDRDNGICANVYRILSVSSAQNRYKVDINARQLGLTGVFVLYEDCNVVVVEGGAKALRKYKTLMLRRIDWDAQQATIETSNAAAAANSGCRPNQCVMIWEGPISKPAFDIFKSVAIPTENGVKSFFRRRGVGAYADLALCSSLGDEYLGIRDIE
jgi:U4/U6 small nuclear ribonucleoprotein PRP3